MEGAGAGEERETNARPVETRVLPREVLEDQMRKVGWERGVRRGAEEEVWWWRRKRKRGS